MSSESIDLLWNNSIEELKRLVAEEEKHGTAEESGGAKPVSIDEAFHHFAKLYVRYALVLSDLNACHEATVQPQKRLDIKSALEGVVCRLINLRHLLVKWCPPNPDVAAKGEAAQASFPWEYPDINGTLAELSIPPSRLEAVTPTYFREYGAEGVRKRDLHVARLLRERSESDTEQLEGEHSCSGDPPAAAVVDASSSEAVQCSGESDDEEEEQHHKSIEALPPEQAAVKIQSVVRGHIGRKRAREFRRQLDSLIGMSSSCGGDRVELDKLESNLADIRSQRRVEQQYCKESYRNDLHRLKDVVRDEEGFRMQHELREERIQWITDHTISKNTLPDSFEGFYTKDEAPENDKENEGTEGGKGGKGKQKESAKSAKEKSGKSKDKKGAEAKELECPVLAANPALLDPLRDCIRIYDERWQHRTVGPARVKSQYHDVEMAKDLIIRDQVKTELTKGVEDTLLSNILKIKAMHEANTKKGKGKKNEGKGKKAKGKKKAGGKGKKEKCLPGAKLPGIQDMSVDDMLGILIQNGLVSLPAEEKHSMVDFIGGFENGRPNLPSTGKQERWIPDDPSAFQLRRAIMDYGILPLGSESIKASIPDDQNVRSVLLYGPQGSGKSLMVQSVASELGALVINLSSSTIGSSFGGKEGATKLIHMAFTVAKEKAYAPVIIHLDNCHEFFMGKSKKKGGAGLAVNAEMQRFQKDLLVYKNQCLKKEDRVIVIGCTSLPEVADVKLLRWKGPSGKPEKQGFFERSLYFPRANHADRAMLWESFVRQRIGGSHWQSKVSSIDYASLAFLSNGWSAGEIASAVNSVLSEERLQGLASRPLSEHDFASQFNKEVAQRNDGERFLSFTRQITALDNVWKSLNSAEKRGGDAKKKK